MRIQQINSISFNAGKLRLIHVTPETLLSAPELKQLAKERNVDITVKKEINNKFLKTFDIYTITTRKHWKNPEKASDKRVFIGKTITIQPKNLQPENLAESAYYEAVMAVDAACERCEKATTLPKKKKPLLTKIIERNLMYKASRTFLRRGI